MIGINRDTNWGGERRAWGKTLYSYSAPQLQSFGHPTSD